MIEKKLCKAIGKKLTCMIKTQNSPLIKNMLYPNLYDIHFL